jgi:hypothetical protein
VIDYFFKKVKDLVGWKREEREKEKRAKRSLVIFLSLIGALIVSILLHNLLTGMFGTQDIVFFVVAISLLIILPFHFLYTAVIVVDYLFKKYLKFK